MHNSCVRSRSRRVAGGFVPSALLAAAVVLVGGLTNSSRAQQLAASSGNGPRNLAPGVMVTIDPAIEPEETVSTHDIVEIRANQDLKWEPQFLSTTRTLYGMADDVKFRRDVWCLEFSFKPVRMIEVDIPQPDGQTERQRVWYMVYRVINQGTVVKPDEQEDGGVALASGASGAIRFIPTFVLEAQDRDAAGRKIYKAYLDRVIPAAVERIRRRETPGRVMLDSAQIAEEPLPSSEGRAARGVWGVATWEDVDPRIDFFSVYVTGLSNAYRWLDPPGAYQLNGPPGKGRRFARKTLQLNFWRPGDEHFEREDEIRYGVPRGMSNLYGVPEGVAYRWVYR